MKDGIETSMDSETDFFQVGGNSLKAGLLVNKIRKEFGVSIAIMKMYVNRTIGSLCTLIREQDPNIVMKLVKQQQEQSNFTDHFSG